MNNEDEMRRLIRRSLDEPMTAEARAKLADAYAGLDSIPQMTLLADEQGVRDFGGTGGREASSAAGHTRKIRRGMAVAAAAVLVVMLGGAAYAASYLLQMQPGEATFFAGGNNLPVYSSLQAGVSSLQADVGETVEVDGVRVTLDSVSCDRSIVNLFFTLEKDGGFDLSELSMYEGSQENEWSRLQGLVPHFRYELKRGDETLETGVVDGLDAYREDGKVKVMQRMVPKELLPDQVDIKLEGDLLRRDVSQGERTPISLQVGLDLSTVAQPRQLETQDVTFSTSAGAKTMGIQRFTASELGVVMVVRNDEVETIEADGRPTYRVSETAMVPWGLKVADDQGNVLTPVGVREGTGFGPEAPYVVEYANLSPDAQSITFTPMVNTVDWMSLSIEERQARNDQRVHSVDVSQIGTKLPTSEYGGYEVVGWNVKDRTVSISLKPYGWHAAGSLELIPVGDVTLLGDTWTNPETGETGKGSHSAIAWRKSDYMTGELMIMSSYYAASDEELRNLTEYRYSAYFGEFREETDAAQTLRLF